MEYKDSKAIYLQIADYLCQTILQKKLNNGDRVPSVRELAVKMEVNPNTAMRTFTYLQEKEIIYNKRGIGYFINDDGYDKTLALKKDEFLRNELPYFIRSMQLLGISISDFEKYIEEFNKKQN